MHYRFIPLMWIIAISFFTITTLGLYSSIYHKVRGSKIFGLCMLFLGCWTISFGLGTIGTDFVTKHFWGNFLYCFYVLIHICWFYMVLHFYSMPKRIRIRIFIPMILIPTITLILIWIKEFNGLVFYGFQIDSGVRISAIGKTFALLYLLNPLSTYAIDILAVILVVRRALFLKTIYGMKTKMFLISPIISVSPTFLYLMSFWIIKGYDIVGILMGLAVVLTAFGGYYLFISAPIAREAAVDNIDIAMIVANSYGMIADVNLAALKLFGKKRKTILGAALRDTLLELGFDTNELFSEEAQEFEISTQETSERICYRVQKLPIVSKHGVQAGAIILLYNITQMQKEKYRQLQQNSIAAATKERERLARDLHDNLAQILASISFQAQGISNELRNEEMGKIDRDLTRLVDISQTAHREIREYIRYVRNPVDEEKNLSQSITFIVHEFEKQSGILASLDICDLELLNQLTDLQKANFTFVIQEALNNILKHAKAHRAAIGIHIINSGVSVTVEDDGIGFDIKLHNRNHFGLRIMKERAAEMNAKIEITSESGKGTSVKLIIPFMTEKHVSL